MASRQVAILKRADQDFEWYPTTTFILDHIKYDIKMVFGKYDDNQPAVSILDCGAGDGRALKALSGGGSMYAIEKSEPLIAGLSEDIYIVGTEFHNCPLIDKKTDVLFCNPPYSEFSQWTTKIIKEANCAIVYLVIPERWKESGAIDMAIKQREARLEILGSFDFLKADRQARAKVDIVKIDLSCKGGYNRKNEPKVDPFVVWFDEHFSIGAEKADSEPEVKTFKEKISNELAPGKNLIQVLVELYAREMSNLVGNYRKLEEVDSALLKEMGVSVSGLREGLKQKISGLKSRYWQEFFNHYSSLTSRLTSKSRKAMLDKLNNNMSIDFTESNALAVTAWAVKNANKYYDQQLVEIVEAMVDQANITMYKSNMRTWGKDDWRYCYSGHGPSDLSRYGLELRIVLNRHSAIKHQHPYSWDFTNNLSNDAHDFITDLQVVANNLGYPSVCDSKSREWESNKTQDFGIMAVKAFKNGNMHIKFNQLLIRKLNVEFGRLKGWLQNKEQASEELSIPKKEIDTMFNCNLQLGVSSVLMLCES